IGRGGSTLPEVLRAVDGADASFEDEFVVLGASPGADGNLAATLQRGEKGALGDDGGARFGIVERAENFRGFVVREAAFGSDSALTDGWHADVGRKRLADAVRPAEAVEAGLGEHHGIVFAAFD